MYLNTKYILFYFYGKKLIGISNTYFKYVNLKYCPSLYRRKFITLNPCCTNCLIKIQSMFNLEDHGSEHIVGGSTINAEREN